VLNVEQFQRFMAVIKKLGDRVEKEHDQFLRDSQRIEDRSATAISGPMDGLTTRGGMDFETLVGGSGATSIKADTELNGNWEDDVWGSILSGTEVRVSLAPKEDMVDPCRASQSPSISQTAFVPPTSVSHSTQSLPSSPRIGASLGAPIPTSRTNAGGNGLRAGSIIPPPPLASSAFASTTSRAISPSAQSLQPKYQGSPLVPQSPPQPPQRSSLPKPNYNIVLSDIATTPAQQPRLTAPLMASPSLINQSHVPMSSALSAPSVAPAFVPPQAMGNILTPLKPQQRPSLPGVGTNRQASKDILSDFDPLA
jgi:SCY1-like protein 2